MGKNYVSQSIIDYLNDNLEPYTCDLELAYMIYVLLCKVLCYSPEYSFNKDDKCLPELGDVTLDNPYVNCHTWSRLFIQVLSHYGIVAGISKDLNNLHSLVEIHIDGLVIYADATKVMLGSGLDYTSDLCNYKYNFEGVSFVLGGSDYRDKSKIQKLEYYRNKVHSKLDICTDDEELLNRYISQLEDPEIDKEDRVILGIRLLNSIYSMVIGASVEKRQILEKYFTKIFGKEYESGYRYYSMYTIENSVIVPHRLIEFDVDGEIIYGLEKTNGFEVVSYDIISNMVASKEIFFKYKKEKELFGGDENRFLVKA